MKNALLIVLLFTIHFSANAQKKINVSLKRELDSIYILDQKYREATSILNSGGNADSIAASFQTTKNGLFMFLINEMQRVDSSNFERIRLILSKYGYPGKTLVGSSSNEVAWNVIQHSPHINKYISLIEKAAKKEELPYPLYCKMLDRLFMEEGKEQVYGTQIQGLNKTNNETGKKEWYMFVWPIRNATDINLRRKKAGFDQSIEAYAKTFGISYQLITLDDVKKMK